MPGALRVFVLDSSVSELWDNCEYIFPPLAVCPAVGQWQPEVDDLLSLKSSVSVNFEGVGRKDLYILAVKFKNLCSLEGLKVSRWTSILEQAPLQGVVGGPCTNLLWTSFREKHSLKRHFVPCGICH